MEKVMSIDFCFVMKNVRILFGYGMGLERLKGVCDVIIGEIE